MHKLHKKSSVGHAYYYLVQNIMFSCLLSESIKIKMYKTVILPVVLYGCETWSFIIREVHKLRMFENRMLRRIFGLKRKEVTGCWRKVHNEECHNMCPFPNIIGVIKSRMGWTVHAPPPPHTHTHTHTQEKQEIHTKF
jgi:hypothetical protein